ncbi:MAG: bifunctional demethylmenaquinone methyltransferase/2-methoxy-6-polyprenyl-1,4-benzoquinol methylase UbiE [Pyrinomonadaceae bacterium]
MPNERTADELKHARTVREMFSRISPKYDFLNHFLSINIDKSWRKLVSKKLKSVLDNKNAVVLDVACGTGDLSIELQTNAQAKIIGTDFCRPMLEIADKKNGKGHVLIPYIEADALSLPFADNSFDAVTIAFGLRNLANWEDGLRELLRILKPNGKLVVLEFSSPIVPGFRQVFQFYFKGILPKIGGIFSGSRGAYEYLSESVSRFPDQKNLAKMMSEVGFSDIEYKNLTGGIAAIHTGTRK